MTTAHLAAMPLLINLYNTIPARGVDDRAPCCEASPYTYIIFITA